MGPTACHAVESDVASGAALAANREAPRGCAAAFCWALCRARSAACRAAEAARSAWCWRAACSVAAVPCALSLLCAKVLARRCAMVAVLCAVALAVSTCCADRSVGVASVRAATQRASARRKARVESSPICCLFKRKLPRCPLQRAHGCAGARGFPYNRVPGERTLRSAEPSLLSVLRRCAASGAALPPSALVRNRHTQRKTVPGKS